jgi:DNA polymerase III sliding clamp (beta) subunit (PCNA family)
MKYSKAQLQIHKFVSKDKAREALNGVYFEGSTTVAADGHQLMMIENSEETTQDETKPFILSTENVKTLEKPLAGKTKSRDFEDSIELNLNGSGKVDAKLLDDGTASFKPIDGRFPNYKQVIPAFKKSDGTPEDEYIKVCLDGHLLAEAAKFLASLNKDHGSVFIYVRSGAGYAQQNSAIILESTGKHFNDSDLHGTAVIMPVRY